MAAASVRPHSKATLASFHTTRSRSEKAISSRDSPRIMVTLACPPAFPPVSINMGMYAVRTTQALNALSKEVMILPVNAAEIIKSRSQGILFFQVSNTPVLI